MISLLQAWLPLPAGVGVEAPGNEGAPESPRGWGAGKGEAALTWPMTGAILMTIPDCEEEAPVSAPPSWERRVEEAGGGGGARKLPSTGTHLACSAVTDAQAPSEEDRLCLSVLTAPLTGLS